MSKRRPRANATTKAEALTEVARLLRRVRSLERQLASSKRRADDAEQEAAERQRSMVEARDRLTATAAVLHIFSGSRADSQPVFDAIVQSAVRLCRGTVAAAFGTDGRMLYHLANYGSGPEGLTLVGEVYRGRSICRASAGLRS